MPVEVPYNREKAVEYARYWAYRRNPQFLNFQDIGGDCTNFVSQCIYAGAGIMNYTPVYGWFYITSSDRTASWTGVPFFYDFLINNKGAGPYAVLTEPAGIQIGDVVQLGDQNNRFYHSLFVIKTGDPVKPENIEIAAHTNDANCRPLITYDISNARYLHIAGVRKEE